MAYLIQAVSEEVPEDLEEAPEDSEEAQAEEVLVEDSVVVVVEVEDSEEEVCQFFLFSNLRF